MKKTIFLFAIFAIVCAVIAFVFLTNDMMFFASLFFLLTFLMILGVKEAIKQEKELQKAKIAWGIEEIKRKKLNQEVKEGKWNFPCEEFYKNCIEINVTSFNNEYGVKKGEQIVNKILYNNKVGKEYYGLFNAPEKMNEFFEKGKLFSERKERAVLNEQKKIKVAVKSGFAVDEVERNNKLFSLKGFWKRLQMLSYEHNYWFEKLHEAEQNKKSVDNLSNYYYNKAEHNHSNWAIAGGIAEGIAGPAAGIAAAMDEMSRENQIQEDNRILKQSAMELKWVSMTEMSEKVNEAKEKLSEISKAMIDAQRKIVLSKPAGKEIGENIDVKDIEVERLDSGALFVSAKVELVKQFELDVPEDTKMVIDGTITGKIYYENQFVDYVYLPLPIYGIENKTGEHEWIYGYCLKSAEYPGKYSMEVTYKNNLWVMEY